MPKAFLFHPIIQDIYHKLTEHHCGTLAELQNTRRKAQKIIQDLIIKRLLRYYKIPNIFQLSLDTNAEDRLLKYLQKLHQQMGKTVSEEEIKQEIEHINTLIDQVIEDVINKENNYE